MKYFKSPYRQYILIAALLLALVHFYFVHGEVKIFLYIIAALGSLQTAADAAVSIWKKKIGIDTFNIFAIVIAFVSGDVPSAAFIALMLTFASWLEWKTESRAGDAVKELLALKPHKALRELHGGEIEEIETVNIRQNDILIVKNGSSIPVDGVVVSGKADVNEASVTGESKLVKKVEGDQLLSGTICASGFLKIKATRVGEDSTLDQMIKLVKQAAMNKSRSEKLADKFAGIFLPLVILLGVGTYLVTRNLIMAGAIFLVACADDMAVAIPLAVSAALGHAAKRGVIIKGGEWLDALSKVTTVVLDKTGTLTYGTIAIKSVEMEPGVDLKDFWFAAGVAEKFSDHPAGKAIFRRAIEEYGAIPDPEGYVLQEGQGVQARSDEKYILVGNMSLLEANGLKKNDLPVGAFAGNNASSATVLFVALNKKVLGTITVADTVRTEAKEALQKLSDMGIETVMLTGDNEAVAKETAEALGIKKYLAALKPEDKLREIEKLSKEGTVCMVGDGINDAPALSRADVGVAMGGGGTAVAVESADIVILTDDLSRLPEMIDLGRRTRGVVNTDIVLWVVSNLIGFILVLTGIFGLAFAAFYNFITDFIPLGNSALFFGNAKKRGS